MKNKKRDFIKKNLFFFCLFTLIYKYNIKKCKNFINLKSYILRYIYIII